MFRNCGLLLVMFVALNSCTEEKLVTPDSDNSPAIELLKLVSIDPAGSIYSDSAVPVTFKVSFNRDVSVYQISYSISPAISKQVLFRSDGILLVLKDPMNRFQEYTHHLQARVQDSRGNELTIDTVWSFRVTSGDTIPPRIELISPSGGSQDVLSGNQSEVVFSEPFDTTALSLEFSPPVAGNIYLSDTSIVFLPRVGFIGGVDYTARLQVVVDDTGRNETAIDTSWAFSISSDSVVFVASGGSGDGSSRSPFGSIGEALEFIDAHPGFGEIRIAVGDYDGSITIDRGVEIIGGFDSLTWELSSVGSTVMHGGMIEGVAVGALIRDVISPVRLSNITILGADAISPGASSYGVYCLDSDSVSLSAMTISSGAGTRGDSGRVFHEAPGGLGGFGGSDHGELVNDGWSIVWISDISYPTSGEQGFCADGSQDGGEAGGGDGQAGVSSWPKLSDVIANVSVILDVFSGQLESSGCGGGGGNGGRAGTPGHSTGARSGGGGDDGGDGGQGGGFSVSILAINSRIYITESSVRSAEGGRGGRGTDPIDKALDDFWTLDNGGSGGYGGGGAGGSSLGILSYLMAPVVGSGVSFQLGIPGAGGASAGNPGEDGIAVEILTVE